MTDPELQPNEGEPVLVRDHLDEVIARMPDKGQQFWPMVTLADEYLAFYLPFCKVRMASHV